MAKAKLIKNGHTIETSVPSEAVQLRAQGYTDVPAKQEPAKTDAPAPKTSK